MKKIALFLLIILSLSLCACGTETTTGAKTVEKFLYEFENSENLNEAGVNIYCPSIKEFAKNEKNEWHFITVTKEKMYKSDLVYSINFETKNEDDIFSPITKADAILFTGISNIDEEYQNAAEMCFICAFIEGLGYSGKEAVGILKEMLNLQDINVSYLSTTLEKEGIELTVEPLRGDGYKAIYISAESIR